MRRTAIFILAAASLGIPAGAARLSPAEALVSALGERHDTDGRQRMASSYTLAWSTADGGVYAFNRAGGGFVIAAGDDSSGASLLGYGDAGKIDPAAMPPALRDALEAFAAGRVEHTPRNGVRQNIEPLLKTRWGQDAPFYNDCPVYEGERCVSGCVATAISQVLNHYKYPSCGTGVASARVYGSDNGLTLDLAEHPIDWENILDDYSDGYSDVEAAAVANLMHVVGMAINTEYSPHSSGATVTDEVKGLTTYLGFDKSLRSLRHDFYTVTEWNEMAYRELSAGKPIVYNGFNAFGGHCFVIDGYDGTDGEFFHVNWGWHGMSDGYFLLINLTPDEQGIGGSAAGYNKNQEAFFNLIPDEGTTGYLPVLGMYGSFGVKVASILKTKDPEFCATCPGVNNYQGFYNVGVEPVSGNLGIKIVDRQTGNVTYAATERRSALSVLGREQTFTIKSADMPGEGEYYVTPAFLYNGEWYDVAQDASTRTEVILTVTDKRFKFSSRSVAADLELTDVSWEPADKFINGREVRIGATLTSHTGAFGGNIIPVLCDGATIVTSMSPRNVSLEPEESVRLEWNEPFGDTLAEGEYNLYIVREEGFKGLFGPVKVEVGDQSGIEETVAGSAPVDTVIYDLTGTPVSRPSAGNVYIVRRGADTFKVRY